MYVSVQKNTGIEKEFPDLKECTRCHQVKDVDSFYNSKKAKDGKMHVCITCDKHRKRLGKFNITQEQFTDMLVEQDFGCAVCGVIPFDGKDLAVDHDHACCPGDFSCGNCIRGLLCRRCNMVLGSVRDNIELLNSMTRYLERK